MATDDRRDFIHAAGASGFVMIPLAVLRDVDLSVGARLLYGELLFRAWRADVLHEDDPPPLEALVASLGIGLTATKGYVRELRAKGLVETRRRGRGLPNAYVVHDPRTADSVSLEGRIPSPRETDSAAPTRARGKAKDLEKRERARNPYFDALVAVFGEPSTRSEASAYGKLAAEVRDAFESAAGSSFARSALTDPAFMQTFALDEVRRRAEALRRAWGADKVTPHSLVKHWTHAGRLASSDFRGVQAAPVSPDDPDYGV